MNEQMNCKIKYVDGHIHYTCVQEVNYGEFTKLTLQEPLNYPEIEYIDFDTERSKANAGESGYYCIIQGRGNSDSALCYFKDRGNTEYIGPSPYMPFIGVKTEKKCYLGVVTGMSERISQIVTIQDGIYRNFVRFHIDCENIYTPIEMYIYNLDNNAGYSEMAKTYRNHQIKYNGFKPIKERLTPELTYAAESLYVRIRQAWKPVPCTILEQTLENEPPVHVACTFKQVCEIMDMYKEKGIEKAEFCLVGWNISGHDGRWPQILPVEPALGGEEELKNLITHAEKLGYLVSCHTNCTDAYSIAENFGLDDIARTKDSKCSIEAERWAGGRTYNVCPQKALNNAKALFPDVRKLGFRGTHYVDVITATPPRNCYHPDHPINDKQGASLLSDLLSYSRELFGASGSEAGYDYSLAGCDYVLYASFGKHRHRSVADKYIPLWQLIYNGIIISNPYASTVNAITSDNPDDILKAIEYNGRPAIYYYAKFVSDGSNWIGKGDFTYEYNEDCAVAAKKYYDIYKELSFLQYEFMEKHEEISPKVYQITYSNGSIVTVDYNQKQYSLVKGA